MGAAGGGGARCLCQAGTMSRRVVCTSVRPLQRQNNSDHDLERALTAARTERAVLPNGPRARTCLPPRKPALPGIS